MRQAVKRALGQSLLGHPRGVLVNTVQPLQSLALWHGIEVIDSSKGVGGGHKVEKQAATLGQSTITLNKPWD
jgi:hypothetical protein